MRPAPEERALWRARWAITAQIAVVVSLLVALAGAIAYGMLLSGQHADADRTLARTIQLGPGTIPPGCVWLFTPGAHAPAGPPPAGMPLPALDGTVPSPGDVHTERRSFGGMTYTIRVENRGGVVSQAFFEERYQIQDRSSLVFGLGVAEVLALLGAVLCGRVLATRAIRPLEDALRRQRTFVADASHELRAPLTRLHTRAQLLARRASGRDAEDLDQLVRGTRELGEVVEDLLLSARACGERPSLEPVELGLLAEEAVAAEAVRAGEGRVRLAVTRERRPYVVQGVPTALRRVLSALLDNALGHTPPGGSIEVWLGVPDERHVELRVRDTGVGFPAADADRLFERFARGPDGDGRRFGIGLALVREVVTGHGGTIAAAGHPGAGATFTLRLLRADPT
ncbi:sensor histidine kinase [Amycolatopsis balhimycina DSM 5908]|uniref:histidine kinase n=1 Tax=Amycolatopsis balhimycina DSM 5908 TaxID=1081091 RepID=A0A428W9S1_AMYBA|nr:HAMP domain-containing sensor histidine kinase [Amycolatopsis balhimycina]RSM39838.1 sensor histidine kinase [Amycolatopsis balhimycina DSM 5908]